MDCPVITITLPVLTRKRLCCREKSQWQPRRGVGGMWSLSGIGLAANLDGRLELMAVATRPGEPDVDVGELTSLWHSWERVELEGGWSGWESFGPVIKTSESLAQTPAVAQDVHGCLWAVVTASDREAWAVAQRHP